MQFGNLGRICSSRPFERQPQELPGKNNSFLPLIIANICNCTKLMGSQFNWRGMPEMEPKMMQDGPVHPWRVQSNATSHQKTQTQPDFDAAALMLLTDLQRLYLWASAQTDWDIHTSGEDTRFPLSASPFSGQGCSASLCSKAPLLSTHAQTHTHGLTYQKRRLRPRCTTTRRPLPQLIRYSPLAVSEGDPASCARLCIHSVTMRAARGSSTAQARVRGDGPAASF